MSEVHQAHPDVADQHVSRNGGTRGSYVPFVLRVTVGCAVHASAGGELVTSDNFTHPNCSCTWTNLVQNLIDSHKYLKDFGVSVCPALSKKQAPSKPGTPKPDDAK